MAPKPPPNRDIIDDEFNSDLRRKDIVTQSGQSYRERKALFLVTNLKWPKRTYGCVFIYFLLWKYFVLLLVPYIRCVYYFHSGSLLINGQGNYLCGTELSSFRHSKYFIVYKNIFCRLYFPQFLVLNIKKAFSIMVKMPLNLHSFFYLFGSNDQRQSTVYFESDMD
jgi:hypothetical protein